MRYANICKGTFIFRKNRFTADIEIDGKPEVCHVKNTGRLSELFIRGTTVFLQKSDNPVRKTKYDLVSLIKDEKYVNVDSFAPNAAVRGWIEKSGVFGNVTRVVPEYKYKNSRFDFYIEADRRKILCEVKGVTLEKNGTALFPDAPTERGVKHIRELCSCVEDGYCAYIIFVVQMKGAESFSPNRERHPEFADALIKAKECGVKILCFDCNVGEDYMEIDTGVRVIL